MSTSDKGQLAGKIGEEARGPAASVVIPVHNAESTITEQLLSLARQDAAPPFEVIAVLNRCTDASAQLIQSFSDRLTLRTVAADERASAAYARNVGARESIASKILFCDADDQVGPLWVTELCHALDEAELVGGPIMVDREGLPDWIYERFYAHLNNQRLNLRDGRIRYPISASMGVQRSALDSVGGFDETFPGAAGEETDLAIRLLRKGCRVGFAPDATITYQPRTSIRGVAGQQRAYGRAIVELADREGLPPRRASRTAEMGQIVRLVAHQFARRRELNLGSIWVESAALRSKARATRQLADSPDATYGNDPGVVDVVIPLEVRGVGGYGILARASIAPWLTRGGAETLSVSLVSELLRPNHIAVDVGANIGLFTLAMARRIGPSGVVVAIEPNEAARRLLLANLTRHGLLDTVRIESCAAASHRHRATMNIYANDLLSGFSPTGWTGVSGSATSVEVDASPLDDLVSQAVDLLKIDVEGHELDVLDGATSLLGRSPDAILLVEINPDAQRLAGRDSELLLQRISTRDRSVWLVEDPVGDRPGSIRPFDDQTRALVLSAPPGWFGNLLSIPASRRAEAMDVIKSVEAATRKC